MDDLKKFDLNLLIIFEAIYSSGNISHAAKRLGMSQPTLSNSLTRLRDMTSDQLFTRAGKGVEPTPKAINMIGSVRAALQLIQEGLSEGGDFDPMRDSRHFRIVLMDQVEPVLIPEMVRQIQNYKNITFEMLPIAQEPVVESLNDGSIDLALVPHFPEAKEIEQETIGQAKVMMMARKGHPEIDGKITLEQYQRLGHIALIPKLRAMTRMDEYLRHAGIKRHITYTTSKFWSFPYMISNTNLIGQVPGDFAIEAARYFPVQVLPMPFELPEQQMFQIWKSNRTTEPSLVWLRNQIETAYNKLPKTI